MRRLAVFLAVVVGLLATAATALAAGPTNISVPAITGTLTEGQQLAATNGTWDNTSSAPSTFAYQWKRCSGASCINIPWAVNSGYVPGRADVGSTLKVAVTATNSGGSTSATSVATATIATNGNSVFYVDGNSVGGTVCSSSGPGTLGGVPYCTIQQAVNAHSTTTASIDIIVRGADNGGTQLAYAGTGTGGRLNLTNDRPTGTVTIEPYGTASQADNVLVKGLLTNGTSDYTIQGMDIADPALPNGCPYSTVQDIAGNLASADYCLPATNVTVESGTSFLTLNDDSLPTQINVAATVGQGCPTACVASSNFTLYGSEIHNTGFNCQQFRGMTTSAQINAGTAYTSIPVVSNAISGTIPTGSVGTVMLYTGTESSPTTYDTWRTGGANTSTAISVVSQVPAHTYPAGTPVDAEYCPNNALEVGIYQNGPVNNVLLSHSQIDHTHCAGTESQGTTWTVTNMVFGWNEPPSNNWGSCHGDSMEVVGALNNFTLENSLLHNSILGLFVGCNTGISPNQQRVCGSNFTITNNVFIGCGSGCIEFGNYVSGSNYIINNTIWNADASASTLFLRWSDSCTAGGSPCPASSTYILNNIGDTLFFLDNGGSTGDPKQQVAQEDYNVWAYQASDPLGAGFGAHDIFNRHSGQPLFATGIGSNCGPFPGGSTAYNDSSCASASTGFNAALLAGSDGIGAGTNGGAIPTTDLLGNARTIPFDMGAFQFSADSAGVIPNGPPIPEPPFLRRGAHASRSHGMADTDIGVAAALGALIAAGAFFWTRRRRG